VAKGITIPIVYKSDLKGLDQANRAIVGFEKQSSLLNKVIGTGMVVAAGAATAAIGGIGFAISKGFGRLQQIENAEFMLKGLGNSAEDIEAIMDSALASVKGTAFGLGDAATIAAQSVAAGVKPGEELTRTLSLLADTAAITGRPLTEIQSILGKVTTTGRASRTELQQLAERGIPIYQMLAEQVGVTEEAIMGMASAGEISGDILMDALENKIGGAALKMGDSTEGAMANTLAAIQRVGANLIGPIYDQFGEFFRAAIEGLEPIEEMAKSVGDTIGKFLNPRLDTLVEFVRNLSVPIQTFVTFMGMLKDQAGGAVSVFQPLVTSFQNMLPVLAPLAPIVKAIADLFALMAVTALPALLTIIQQLMDQAIPVLIDAFVRLAPPLLEIANTMLEMLSPIILELAQMAIPLFVGILQILIPIVEFVAKVIAGMDEALVQIGVAVFIAVKAFALLRAGLLIGRGLMIGFALATYGATGATYANTTAQKLGVIVGNLLNGTTLRGVAARVAERVALVSSRVGMVAMTVATWAQVAAQKALNFVLNMNPLFRIFLLLSAVTTGLIWFFTNTEIGRKIFQGAFEAITAITQAFADLFILFFTEILPARWEAFVEGIGRLWDGLKDVFKAVLNFIGGLIEGYINSWISMFEGFVNGIIAGVNFMIRALNRLSITIPAIGDSPERTIGFNVPEIGKLSLGRVSIPELADGGFVDSPTLAMIGEAGPEAVVPLSKGRGMGATYNITVNAGLGADGQRIGEQIIREIKRYERQSGPVFARA